MMNKHIKYGLLLLSLIAVWLAYGSVLAQTGGGYDLSWWTVDGGGSAVSGGAYALMGTVGQPEPGAVLTGGTFTLYSGFWPAGGAARYSIYLPLVLK
jgi:hypothetical protein